MGQLFYVSDVGLRFRIKDLPSAAALGVSGVKDADGQGRDSRNWLRGRSSRCFRRGRSCLQEAALIAHDGMPADPHGQTVEQPKS